MKKFKIKKIPLEKKKPTKIKLFLKIAVVFFTLSLVATGIGTVVHFIIDHQWRSPIIFQTPYYKEITSPLVSGLSVNSEQVEQAPQVSEGVTYQDDTTPLEEPQTELEKVISYITKVFEPEGKDVVVRAINCFYSESGLRANAVGQNKDKHKSKDHGVAQLNDYWHNLTPEMKTDIYANIDKAYEIYKGRGDNFSAWYGRLCNN